MPIKELPDDLRDDPALRDFNDLPSLAKSFKETKTFVGRSIQPPGEAATPEQKKEFYAKLQQHAPHLVPLDDKDEAAQGIVWEKLGRPKDATGYEFKPPDGVSVNIEALRETAKALGLTKAQFSKMAEQAVAMHTKSADASKADQTALKTEWGAAYQEKLAAAASAAEKLGLPAETVAAIKAGTVKSDSLKTWSNIAKAIGAEPGAEMNRQKGQEHKPALTPAEAETEIAALQAGGALYDKNHPQHAVAAARYLKLVEYTMAPG